MKMEIITLIKKADEAIDRWLLHLIEHIDSVYRRESEQN